jgi:DNA helicase II / ATP-dependent DNA helicase PcrA
MASVLDDLTVADVHLLARGTVELIYGPPGTGKSTRLTREITQLVRDHGPDSVMVTSFTVTAAKSIAAMGKGDTSHAGTGLPDNQVGTLHSMAWRAIGHSNVATDKKVLADWNTRVPPAWRLSADARRGSPLSDAGDIVGGSDGDTLLGAYDLGRSMLLPVAALPHNVRQFAETWETWKKRSDAVDFTDMITMALERAIDGERAPGNPKFLIADEAQDMTPLEIALVLAWGRHAQRTIFALDDDQAIMSWRGGDPTPLLNLGTGPDGAPQEDLDLHPRVLDQSYRIPSSVHAVAEHWVRLCSRRAEKAYRPRGEVGQIYGVGAHLGSMATAEQIAKDAHAGRTVMALAACEYMLQPLLANLRKIGVPYANQYRPTETRWNPLSNPNGMTTGQRLYRYLVADERLLGDDARLWTGDDVRAWMHLVDSKAAHLARGAKTAMLQVLPNGTLDLAQVEALFKDGEAGDAELVRATEPELSWLMQRALPSFADKLEYPARIADKFGPASLVDPPPVTVGTIHSVKGADASVVYLSPSISTAAATEWNAGGGKRDNVIRQFYVGLTRAKRTCVVLGSMERAVPRSVLLPGELMVR